jgi:eukaryotic-like serine/threonine-protein kinase
MTAAATRACPNCSTGIPSDSKFCPSCGTAVSGIFSGGGSPLDGTAVVPVEQVDTLFPILQDATLGDYDIYGELGRGGMAAVYLALDLSLNRKVAIKTMLPDLVSKTGMVDRFKREAQTAAALSHPHIIQIFSVKQTKSLVYFVMKYIEGRSLESVIIERGKLDVDLTRVILSQVGGALAFAHRKGVVHRDMKPANIMLEEDGWAIVTDFGIAKVQEAQNLTATGTAIGTPHYMSPEQFHNKAVTGASDQYSLGIVAYEMLTGRKPFDGATYAEIITQHLFEPPPDLRTVRSDIPDNVADTIMRMMSKEASARFTDLDAAVTALGTATTTQGEKARTQMIQLAKAGGPRPVRMSVPQSPIPAQRRAAEPTVVEDPSRPAAVKKPARPRPEPTKAKSHAVTIIAATILLAVGGGGMWMYMTGKFSPKKDQAGDKQQVSLASTPTASPTTSTPVDSTTAPTAVDSSAIVASAPPPAETKPQPVETKAAAKPPKSRTKTDAKPPASAKSESGTKTATKTETTKSVDRPKTEAAAPAPKEVAAPVPPPKPTSISGQIKIGTPTEAAVLYIDGSVWGALKGIPTIDVKAKADGQLHLQIKADKCTTWDSTVTINSGALTVIGRRPLTCQP